MQLSVKNPFSGRVIFIDYDKADSVIGHSLEGMRWWDFMTIGRLYRASISYTGNSIFVDVGANIGTTSALAGEWFEFVICFEPMPQNVAFLKRNLFQNGIASLVIQKAVASASNRTIGFCGYNHQNSGVAHAMRQNETDADSISVKTIRLDDALTGMNPAFLHIDAEGYDLICLASYLSRISPLETERSSRPFVQIEFCPQAFVHYADSLDTLWSFMVNYSYCSYVVLNNHLAPIDINVLKGMSSDWQNAGGNIWTDLLLLPREFQCIDFYRA